MTRSAIIIEDDPALRRIIEVALGRIAGWSVRSAEGLAAAVALGAPAPDVYLVDVMLGDEDGRSILGLFDDGSLARAPFLFVTALVRQTQRAEYMELGAIGVIEKPFDPTKLADAVERALEQHLAGEGRR
ncbi:MAG: response regulator [Myxococcales bacterium]|nr:response regulator [Myxococcales bacterium]